MQKETSQFLSFPIPTVTDVYPAAFDRRLQLTEGNELQCTLDAEGGKTCTLESQPIPNLMTVGMIGRWYTRDP